MKLLLAAYDPSVESDIGNYWAWAHPSISRPTLDSMYYDVIADRRPADPNKLTKEDVAGGCSSLDGDRCFWYRFFNGDRDRNGRPGRFVVVVALLNSRDINRCGWNTFLTSPLMQTFAEHSASIPILSPMSLEIEWDEQSTIATDELRNHINGKTVVSLTEREIGPALSLVAETPNLKSFHLCADWGENMVRTTLNSDSPIQLLPLNTPILNFESSPTNSTAQNVSFSETQSEIGNRHQNTFRNFLAVFRQESRVGTNNGSVREAQKRFGPKDFVIVILVLLVSFLALLVSFLLWYIFSANKHANRIIINPMGPVTPNSVEPPATQSSNCMIEGIRKFSPFSPDTEQKSAGRRSTQ